MAFFRHIEDRPLFLQDGEEERKERLKGKVHHGKGGKRKKKEGGKKARRPSFKGRGTSRSTQREKKGEKGSSKTP